MTTRTTRRPARPAQASSAELAARLAALEERVARLETGKPPPGDGRAVIRRRSATRRCPGCGLPVRLVRRRCANCGRPDEAVPLPRRR